MQGAELLALQGATATLPSVEFILLEAPTLQYNKGSPSVVDFFNYMDSIDFIVFDIIDLKYVRSRTFPMLVQADIIFVKRTSRFAQKKSTGFEPFPKSRYICNRTIDVAKV